MAGEQGAGVMLLPFQGGVAGRFRYPGRCPGLYAALRLQRAGGVNAGGCAGGSGNFFWGRRPYNCGGGTPDEGGCAFDDMAGGVAPGGR